ncbi:dihydrolipoamide succinyltransferase [Sulfuriferula sp. AH1]|uniref:dihydrolipoyllysine-residue succinyltransferase n=1 Tax=Sulfuriferula sp. AH1 TaxID=1985873 RepID=UPI000B3B5C9B|nr:dihydrolipoyllysine-residue succinyltransferase [Sulfuriferula sp. AH1]ARU31235.1 dihydrolipoamide succinyltransferase [Sulfuriferula sp. AH1]
MLIDVKTPELSDSITEGTLLEWHKQVGDKVSRDETLIDLETDKVILEIAAPGSGVLVELLRENGAVVKAGEVIARIDNGEAAIAAAEPAESVHEVPVVPPQQKNERGAPVASTGIVPSHHVEAPEMASEHTRTMLAKLPGTGDGRSRRQPMSRIRQRTAQRLVEAQHTAAILTTFNEVNMQPVKDLRMQYQEDFQREHGVKLGFMPFFVKAAVQALKQFPIINAVIDGQDIVFHDHYDIGIAVSTTRGLIVPVLRNADALDFAQIERAIGDFAQRAETMSLGLDEISGGTFSISNGGVFGSLLSTPIVNPPQSAILGMHAIQERPIAEHGQVVIRPMMYLALSYDHRLIDGRDAVRFLVEIKAALEDPARLLLGI